MYSDDFLTLLALPFSAMVCRISGRSWLSSAGLPCHSPHNLPTDTLSIIPCLCFHKIWHYHYAPFHNEDISYCYFYFCVYCFLSFFASVVGLSAPLDRPSPFAFSLSGLKTLADYLVVNSKGEA